MTDKFAKDTWKESHASTWGKVVEIERFPASSGKPFILHYVNSVGDMGAVEIDADVLFRSRVTDPTVDDIIVEIFQDGDVKLKHNKYDDLAPQSKAKGLRLGKISNDIQYEQKEMSSADALQRLAGKQVAEGQSIEEMQAEIDKQSDNHGTIDPSKEIKIGGAGPGKYVIFNTGGFEAASDGAKIGLSASRHTIVANQEKTNLSPGGKTYGISKLPDDDKYNIQAGPKFWPKYNVDLSDLTLGTGVLGKITSIIGGLL